ncbi:hypothetical protein [Calothrix sp. 336/3]|uniref:hypothetical protein n=1 Tax=Calothrix sp. 336/3 TaxID=1337936 RepID=UPI0011876FAF|nr:hypothetical protein [Calothrix sp. 336/3]
MSIRPDFSRTMRQAKLDVLHTEMHQKLSVSFQTVNCCKNGYVADGATTMRKTNRHAIQSV